MGVRCTITEVPKHNVDINKKKKTDEQNLRRLRRAYDYYYYLRFGSRYVPAAAYS